MTGGAIAAHVEENVKGAGPSFATEAVDVEVDPETGKVTILRFTVVQDAGKAIHPSYVEGQYQSAAAQGIAGRSTRSISTTTTGGWRTQTSSTTAFPWLRICR